MADFEIRYTLPEVIQGLAQGKSYEREDDDGVSILTSIDLGSFRHDYMSKDPAGGGGSAELGLSVLENSRWPEDNWKEV